MKKFLSLICVLVMLITTVPTVNAKGQGFAKSAIDILVEYGYTKESAEVLPEDKRIEIVSALLENPEKVAISTVTMEVDTLAEIEALFTYSADELNEMGADMEAVEKSKRELMIYYSLEVPELSKQLGVSETEAEIFSRAIQRGMDNNNGKTKKHEKKSGVMASGSITSSEMTYTQTVRDLSSDSAPEYDVTISYCWKEVYGYAVFTDKIAAAWGGGLNTSYIDGEAEYYTYSDLIGNFTSYYGKKKMDVTEQIQAGIIFSFPQSIYTEAAKTRSGFATFTLYQTKLQGYDTKIVSCFCHRILALKSATISFDVEGFSVGLTIGGSYHTTAQKKTTISY